MNYLDIRCPSGHLEKVPINSNDPLVKALESVCSRRNLDSRRCNLIYRKKSLDLSMPFRYSGLLNHANVELVLSEEFSDEDVTENVSQKAVRVCISLESGHRVELNCFVSDCLWTMLESLSATDTQISDFMTENSNDGLEPAIIYLRQQICGISNLKASTLSSLGIRDGSVLLQLVRKIPAPDDPTKQLTSFPREINSKNSKATPTIRASSSLTSVPDNVPTSYNVASTSSQIRNVTDNPSQDNPFGIFSERPARSMFDKEEDVVTKIGKSSTVGELLGISLEPDKNVESRNCVPENLLNFKFPEETAGHELYKKESGSVMTTPPTYDRCEREASAYCVKSSLSSASSGSEELPDEYFQLTEAELRSIISSLRQEAAESSFGALNIRQAARARFYSRYPRCIIKFVWPDDFVIQACFLPHEPVSSLYEFLRTYMAENCKEFTLFTSPPKLNLTQMAITLIEANLVPMSRIYVTTICGFSKATDALNLELLSDVMRDSPESADVIAANWISKRPAS